MEEHIIQNQIAIFNVIGALAYKLTGTIPHVTIERDGERIIAIPTIDSITFQGEELQGK